MRRGCGFELADADAGRLFDAGAMLADCGFEFAETHAREAFERLDVRAEIPVERGGAVASRHVETLPVRAERAFELAEMAVGGGLESLVMLGSLPSKSAVRCRAMASMRAPWPSSVVSNCWSRSAIENSKV